MKYIPGVFCILMALDDHEIGARRGGSAWVLQGLVILACLGLPARLVLAGIEHDTWDYDHIRQFVDGNIRRDEIVAASPEAYYPVKQRAEFLYLLPHVKFLTERQKETIDVIIGRPGEARALLPGVKGRWRIVATYAAPAGLPASGRLGRRFGWPLYELAVYRRAEARRPPG